MEKKRIESYFGDRYPDEKEHEFEICITSNKNEISNNIKDTVVLVNNEDEINKAYESIDYTNKYTGLITVSLWDLYNKFYESGFWNYKHIKLTELDEVKDELRNITTNDIFIVFWCNAGSNGEDLISILDVVLDKNLNVGNWFSMPVIYDKVKSEYELGIFYR